jgi:hypothetical protein
LFSNDNATEPQARIRGELAELLAVGNQVTFFITVWRLYGGSKGLVMWYYQLLAAGPAAAAPPPEASLREIMARGKSRQARRARHGRQEETAALRPQQQEPLRAHAVGKVKFTGLTQNSQVDPAV